MKYLNGDYKKDLLPTSSGDHILEAVLSGITNITCYDINNLAKYFAKLKLGAIKSLSKEEFLHYMYEDLLNKEILNYIKDNLDDNTYLFWNELFNRSSKDDIYFRLFRLMGIYDNQGNEINPDLVEDDDMIIFNLESLGFSIQEAELFLRYNVVLYNYIKQKTSIKEEKLLVENGYVVGLDYSPLESATIHMFEKLSFSEKIDFIAEIMIRYDNRTYFRYYQTGVGFTEDLTGFDIAKRIMEFKKKYVDQEC